MNAKHLEEVNNLKYLRATVSKDGRSTVEVKTRLAMATPSLSRLFRILRSSDISLSSKLIHYKCVVLLIPLYRCGNWTLTDGLENRLIFFEVKCC